MTPPRAAFDRLEGLVALGRRTVVIEHDPDVFARCEAAANAARGPAALQADVGGLSADQTRTLLSTLTTTKRQVDAQICKAVSHLTRLEIAEAEAAAPDDVRARDRAVRDVARELREDLRMTPTQVKAARAVGDRFTDVPGLEDAMASGDVTAAHARVLDRTVRELGRDDRARLTAELLAAAAELPVDRFGQLCRRRLAEIDLEAAEQAEHRRHVRRRGAGTQTADGMFALSVEVAGLDAEIAATALHAFRRPDGPGEHRTSEQRTADAFVDVCRAALDSSNAPTKHGVKPHVVVTVDLDTLTDVGGSPVAQAQWTGPVIWGRVRQILDDSSVSFLGLGRGLPMAVTEEVRTVPVALWRGLQHRDGGCIHHRCDMPAAWTQVMHLKVPFRAGGKLSRTNAALGCAQHHLAYDEGRLILRWRNGRPELREPGDPPG